MHVFLGDCWLEMCGLDSALIFMVGHGGLYLGGGNGDLQGWQYMT